MEKEQKQLAEENEADRLKREKAELRATLRKAQSQNQATLAELMGKGPGGKGGANSSQWQRGPPDRPGGKKGSG